VTLVYRVMVALSIVVPVYVYLINSCFCMWFEYRYFQVVVNYTSDTFSSVL